MTAERRLSASGCGCHKWRPWSFSRWRNGRTGFTGAETGRLIIIAVSVLTALVHIKMSQMSEWW